MNKQKKTNMNGKQTNINIPLKSSGFIGGTGTKYLIITPSKSVVKIVS